jgi:hypothetical protein
VELLETPDRSEPYANPYAPLLGAPDRHRAWTVPAAVLRDGLNQLELAFRQGEKPAAVA